MTPNLPAHAPEDFRHLPPDVATTLAAATEAENRPLTATPLTDNFFEGDTIPEIFDIIFFVKALERKLAETTTERDSFCGQLDGMAALYLAAKKDHQNWVDSWHHDTGKLCAELSAEQAKCAAMREAFRDSRCSCHDEPEGTDCEYCRRRAAALEGDAGAALLAELASKTARIAELETIELEYRKESHRQAEQYALDCAALLAELAELRSFKQQQEKTDIIDRRALLKKLRKELDNYTAEHFVTDPETGVSEGGKACEEYRSYLEETIEAIELFHSMQQHEKGGDAKCQPTINGPTTQGPACDSAQTSDPDARTPNIQMNISDLKPSAFTSTPMGSILQKREAEVIAQNIMIIRKRVGDRWAITWKEYKAERLKDSGFSEIEKSCFDEVLPLISDVIGAIALAPAWARDARKASSAEA